ncbi:MAG TPA: 4-alpha-glucanotransferase [Clostridia bacterium]|nr:4-alpha-glucanotransferase [Clostridia bacterium]
MERSSGILLPVFSLPSAGGIGTFGKDAYDFVDFLNAAGQSYWQLLPLGPTSYGDSPYQSFSAYAGNPYFIDPGLLMEEGLLTKEEFLLYANEDSESVDYAAVYETRFELLKLAAKRGLIKDASAFARFQTENENWLKDYTLFIALKRYFQMRSWTEWEDDDIRLRKNAAMEHYSKLLSTDMEIIAYEQYKFYEQYTSLRDYAHQKGVKFLGDLPIYVAMDSADVWASPENFLLDESLNPIAVAGVPPDHFTKTGQLWGNPLYRWEDMKKNGYAWWKARIRGANMLYDAIRIDHFRGFAGYWSVDAKESTAVNGKWVQGPGADFIRTLRDASEGMEIIAEDLGYLDTSVHELLKLSGFPGMKVLEFAFDSREPSDYLPHTYPENCVCYLGTHDNAPILAWLEETAPEDLEFAKEYLGLNEKEGFSLGLLRGGMGSVATLFVAQMQDWLNLGKESRTNIPGTLGGNWKWRMKKGALSDALAQKIRRMSYIYGRAGKS